MTRLLVVEDQPNDLRIAADLANSMGISIVDARTSSHAARVYLEKALHGDSPLPDAIILDLDLGFESGHEILRFWHSNPRLSTIPMIVWTILGEEQREICQLFRVNAFVSKWEGISAFRKALSSLAQAS